MTWQCLCCCSAYFSSVGRGAISLLPIGLKSMQNSTFLVVLRPIFAPKMKTASLTEMGSRSCEGLPVIWTRKVEFFSGAHPKLVRRSDWILVKTFFFGDHLILAEKSLQIGSRLMKIWVKFVYCCFHLSKKPPPPLRNPGYAPGMFNVLIFCHLIASQANCLMMHKSFLAITTSCLEETVTYLLKSEDFFEFLSTEFAACLKLPSRDKSS